MDVYLIVHLSLLVVLYSVLRSGEAQPVCYAPAAASGDHIELHEDFLDNAWVRAGEQVRIKCSQFYIPIRGNDYSTCQNDGSWSDVQLRCRAMECSRMDDPVNGYARIDSYTVGSIARFYCYKGYEIEGHRQAMCMSNMEFEPSYPPDCTVVMCHAGQYFRNGYVQNENQGRKSFSYQTVNRYFCNPGYRVEGPETRQCGADGEWEGTEPYCKEIVCEKLGPLNNGRIQYSHKRRKEGSFAFFMCNKNSDRIPDIDVAICLETEKWSESLPQCLKQAILKPVKRGYVYINASRHHLRRETSVRHGTHIRLGCDAQSELYSTAETRYLDRLAVFFSQNINGTWTPALPKCVFKRCDVTDRKYYKYKFTFNNGTAVPVKVDHDSELLVSCISKYEFEDELEDDPSSCVCKRGTIRQAPRCEPAFCSISLEENVFLVTGSVDIVDDIRRIRSGTKVFFKCTNTNDYELFLDGYTDAVSDTCSFGNWTNNRIPECKEKRCPLDVYEGAVFFNLRTNATFRQSTKVESGSGVGIKCSDGFRMVDGDDQPVAFTTKETYATCTKGKWSSGSKCVPVPCPLTYEAGHMFYTTKNLDGRNQPVTSGSKVTNGSVVFANCENDFQLELKGTAITSFSATCTRGEWSVKLFPVCVEKPCQLLVRDGSDYWTNNNGVKQVLHKDTRISSGTRVYIGCHPRHRFKLTRGNPVAGDTKYSECIKGLWSRIYVCEPHRCDIPGYPVANGYVKFYMTNTRLDQARVKHGTKVKVRCNDDYEISLNGEPVSEFISECILGQFSKLPFPECILRQSSTTEKSANREDTKNNNTESVQTHESIVNVTDNRKQLTTTVNTANGISVHHTMPAFTTASETKQAGTASAMSTDGPIETTDAAVNTTLATSKASFEEPNYNSSSLSGAENDILDYKGCILPTSFNMELFMEFEDYSHGDRVPHGYSLDVSCLTVNYEPMENITAVCDDGIWLRMPDCNSDDEAPDSTSGQSSCRIANGHIYQQPWDTSVYNISCKVGYQLNYIAKFYKCRNGRLFPVIDGFSVDTSLGVIAQCMPGSCQLPYSLPFGMKIKSLNGTYYSGGNTITHQWMVIMSCPEGFEPHGRKFRCNAAEWLPVTSEWRSKTYSSETLECRQAICDPDCHGGVCITDDNCTCDKGNYGTSCEKAYCLPIEGIELLPKQGLYSDSDKPRDVKCIDQSLAYRGPEHLICLSNGTWNGNPICISKSRTYFIHFILSNKAHLRHPVDHGIQLQGSEYRTNFAVMKFNKSFQQRYYQHYIFKFVAENLDQVERVTMSSPFSSKVFVWKIKLERRDTTTIYDAIIEDYVSSGSQYVVKLTRKIAFYTQFDLQTGTIPAYYRQHSQHWLAQSNRYQHSARYTLCAAKCVQERKFTCAAFVITLFPSSCTTLPYTMAEYPRFFVKGHHFETAFISVYTRQLELSERRS